MWVSRAAYEALERRVAELEGMVRELSERLDGLGAGRGPMAEAPYVGEVRRLVQRGRMIQAVTLYRQYTGLGLKEAKEAVDRIAQG